MPLQLRQTIERVGAAQLAGVDQAHEQVAHLGAVQRLIKQRILAMQDRAFQRPLTDIVIERSAGTELSTKMGLNCLRHQAGGKTEFR